MSSKNLVLNFRWHIPNQLATGGKPSRPEQLDWLLSQGVKAIVSLTDIPDQIITLIKEAGAEYLSLDVDDEVEVEKKGMGDKQLFIRSLGYLKGISMDSFKRFCLFVNRNIESGSPVFIHCDAGAKRSPSLARMYLEQQLRTTGWLLAKKCGGNGRERSCHIL